MYCLVDGFILKVSSEPFIIVQKLCCLVDAFILKVSFELFIVYRKLDIIW